MVIILQPALIIYSNNADQSRRKIYYSKHGYCHGIYYLIWIYWLVEIDNVTTKGWYPMINLFNVFYYVRWHTTYTIIIYNLQKPNLNFTNNLNNKKNKMKSPTPGHTYPGLLVVPLVSVLSLSAQIILKQYTNKIFSLKNKMYCWDFKMILLLIKESKTKRNHIGSKHSKPIWLPYLGFILPIIVQCVSRISLNIGISTIARSHLKIKSNIKREDRLEEVWQGVGGVLNFMTSDFKIDKGI